MIAPEPRAGADRLIAAVGAALVASNPDPADMLAAVIEVLRTARPAIWSAALIGRDPDVVSVFSSHERFPSMPAYIEAMLQERGPAPARVSTAVIRSGEPLLIPRISTRDFLLRYVGDAALAFVESHPLPMELREVAALVVPMRAHGATLGTLGMFLPAAPDAVAEDDISWLQVVADLTAHFVDNRQLRDSAARNLHRFNIAADVAHAIATVADLGVTLKMIVDRTAVAAAVDACQVLLLDATEPALVSAAATGFIAPRAHGMRVAADDPVLERALARGRLENVHSSAEVAHGARGSMFIREGFHAYAAFPLAFRGEQLGVLEVFHRAAIDPDRDWFDFVRGLADMATLAVQAAGRRTSRTPSRREGASRPPAFSPVELEVLRLVVEGLTNREIALRVHLSPSTVKFRVRQMLDKTGGVNRTDLTRQAISEGWLEAPPKD